MPVSYDFAMWNGDEPLESEEAAVIYEELVEHGASSRVKPTPNIALLHTELKKLFPEPRRGKEDDWPLAAPPDVGAGHVIVSVSQSRLQEVWTIIGELAGKYDLTWYDPQQEHVQLPAKLSQKRTRLRAKRRREAGG